MATQFISDNPSAILRDVYNGDYVQGIAEKFKEFSGKIKGLALLNAINSREGFSFKKIFDEGGCCYIIDFTGQSPSADAAVKRRIRDKIHPPEMVKIQSLMATTIVAMQVYYDGIV